MAPAAGRHADGAPFGLAAGAFDAALRHARRGCASPPWSSFSPDRVRRDFPLLGERVNGRPLVWLDNAATTQKPRCVIERLRYFYEHENSNIHRAAHAMAARATDAYEGARETVRAFLNAAAANEIVFVRGATEAINLVAQSWGRQEIGQDDEIVVSALEHHANIVPWQQLCAQTGAKLRVIPVDDDGQVLMAEYAALLNRRTRLVAFAHVSNALGTVTPAQQMVALAHACGARVLVDGAQAVSHMGVDVRAARLRLVRLFRPQGVRAHRHRRPVWQGGAAQCLPAVARRRQHDRGRDVRAHPLSSRAGPFRGRHRQYRRRRRAGRRARLRQPHRHGADQPTTNTACWGTPPRSCSASPACA